MSSYRGKIALVCNECRQPMENKQEYCPSCGMKLKKRRMWPSIGVLLGVLFLFIDNILPLGLWLIVVFGVIWLALPPKHQVTEMYMPEGELEGDIETLVVGSRERKAASPSRRVYSTETARQREHIAETECGKIADQLAAVSEKLGGLARFENQISDLHRVQFSLEKSLRQLENQMADFDSDPEAQHVEAVQDMRERVMAMKKAITARLHQFHSMFAELGDTSFEMKISDLEIALRQAIETLGQAQENLDEVKSLNLETLNERIIQMEAEVHKRWAAHRIEGVPAATTAPATRATAAAAAASASYPVEVPTPRDQETATFPVKTRVKYEAKEGEEMASFTLRSVINEKIVSNIYALLGVAFLVVGFTSLFTYAYINWVLVVFAADVDVSTAWMGVGILFAIATFLVLVAVIVHPDSASKLPVIKQLPLQSKIAGSVGKNLWGPVASVGVLLAIATSMIQTYYFEKLPNTTHGIAYFCIVLAGCTFATSYLLRSKTLGMTGMVLGLLVGFMSCTDARFLSDDIFSSSGTVHQAIVSLIFLGSLGAGALLTVRKSDWLPLAVFTIVAPVIWNTGHEHIMLPEMLLLCLAVFNILIVVSDRMPTPASFTQFFGTVSLFYPNLMAFSIVGKAESRLASIWGTLDVAIVFGGFFVLFWLFALCEQEIKISFKYPVRPDFKAETIVLRSFEKRVNWVMLSSLAILFVAGFFLHTMGKGDVLMLFALILVITAILGMRKGLDEIVPGSIILMIAEAQWFYVFSLASGHADPFQGALFVVLFACLFEFIVRHWPHLRIGKGKLDPSHLLHAICLVSLVNALLPMNSKYGGAMFLLASVTWAAIALSTFFRRDASKEQAVSRHLALLTGMLIQIGSGLIRGDWVFEIKNDDQLIGILNHIALNAALLIFPVMAVMLAFKGDKLKLTVPSFAPCMETATQPKDSSTDEEEEEEDLTFLQRIAKGSNSLLFPQIIVLVLPAIIFAFGPSYFYNDVDLQAIMLAHVLWFLVLVPLLMKISMRQGTETFGRLAGYSAYYPLTCCFVVLGGAQRVYDWVTQASHEGKLGEGGDYVLPLQYLVLLGVVSFFISIALTFWLGNSHTQLRSGDPTTLTATTPTGEAVKETADDEGAESVEQKEEEKK